MANWLITGVSSGIGRALAKAVAARGDTVVGTVRSEAARAEFEAANPGAIGLVLDVRDTAAIPATVAEAERRTGGLDVFVNNAGYGMAGAIEETDLAEAKALFDVNVFGAIAMIQAVLPAMRARRAGHILNVTSVSGWAPWAGTAIYGASKYAMECIGLTLAQEVAPFGIRVTNVAPGGVRTDFGSRSLVEAARVIDDYKDGAGRARAVLRAGEHKGDPDLAARAILTALAAPEPPLNLLLGHDAIHYAEDQLAALSGRLEQWRELSLSIAADD